jgi:hypothetical protein
LAKDRHRGQAMVEFALVVSVFLFVVFVTISAELYAFELESAVGAASISVRIAAGATDDAPVTSLGDNSQALLVAEQRALQIAKPALLGDTIRLAGGRSCAGYVAAYPGDVVICAYNETDAFGVPTGLTTVRIKGQASLVIPVAFGFKSGAPIDIHESVHRLTFQR